MTLVWGIVSSGVASDAAWVKLADIASFVATSGSTMLGRMAWHATITFSILWVIERCWRSMPANYRCWLWRLAYLKVVLASLIPLAALAHWPLVGWHFSQASSQPLPSVSSTAIYVLEATGPSLEVAEPQDGDERAEASATERSTRWLAWRGGMSRQVKWLVLAVWCIWLVVAVAAGWREYSQLRRICRRARPVTDQLLSAEYRRLARRFGVARPPRLIQGPQRAGPLLLLGRRLVILLPQQFLASTSLNDQRMALAHELAHVVRRDLAWNMLAAVVQLCVGFLPVCWIAARRYRAAQEAASDALAIERGQLVPRDYASLIVRTVNRHSTSRFDISTVALSQWSPFATLTERIQAMQSHSMSRRRQLAALVFSLMCGLCALAPWAIAEESPAGDTKPAATETDSASAESDEKSAQDKSDQDKDKDKDKDKSAKDKDKSDKGQSDKIRSDSRKIRQEKAGRGRYESSDRYSSEQDDYVSERIEKKTRIGYSAGASSGASAGAQASGQAFGSGGGSSIQNGIGSANVGGHSSVSVSSSDDEPDSDRTESASDEYRRGGSEDRPLRRERRRSLTLSGAGSSTSGDHGAQVMRREEETDGGRVVNVAVQEKGRSLQFRVSDDEGIEVTVVTVQAGPDDVMTVRAANADELKSQHPELFALYDKYVVKTKGRNSVRSIRRSTRSSDSRPAETDRASEANDEELREEETRIETSAGGDAELLDALEDPNHGRNELKRMIRKQLDELPEDANQLRQLLEDQLRELDQAE